ncbi:MAG: hypothetical protein N7Q72_02260, partial [Spiroplasma sp. Tabriz.8]|nr:hypothetical protein [Spiroplasma sp. Tabriz.8]
IIFIFLIYFIYYLLLRKSSSENLTNFFPTRTSLILKKVRIYIYIYIYIYWIEDIFLSNIHN